MGVQLSGQTALHDRVTTRLVVEKPAFSRFVADDRFHRREFLAARNLPNKEGVLDQISTSEVNMLDTLTRLNVTQEGNEFVLAKEGRKSETVSFEQLFAIGHKLVALQKPKAAEDAFEQLSKIKGRGQRAKLMLARCKAELEKYEECERIVESMFPGKKKLAEQLQTAFVFDSMGMTKDAIKQMTAVVNHHRKLPTACLYLGDLFHDLGDVRMAVRCWKLAIRRDRSRGAVAMLARKQIDRITEALRKRGRKSRRRSKSATTTRTGR